MNNLYLKEDELQKEISNLEKQIDSATGPDPLNQNANERMKALKEELEKIIEHRTKGAFFGQSQSGITKVKRTQNTSSAWKRDTLNKER